MKIQSLLTKTAVLAIVLTVPLFGQAEDQPVTVKSAETILKQIQIEGRVSFDQESLPFKLDSTELANKTAYLQLAQIAKSMKMPGMEKARFMLVGHTCDLGSDKYNLGLSKRRAAAIRAQLEKAGISGDRLVTDGRGEAAPAVPNNSEANRAKNRRVEMKILK